MSFMDNHPSSSRADRKTIERNRRNHMKTLYSKLNSLLPRESFRDVTSLPDQLHEATNYVKKLQINVQQLRDKKDSLLKDTRRCSSSYCRGAIAAGTRSPQVKIQEVGSGLEVTLITGLDCQFMFNETIRILDEEGAEVINASFSVVGNTVFHTIHAKIGESGSNVGTTRIVARLNNFFQR